MDFTLERRRQTIAKSEKSKLTEQNAELVEMLNPQQSLEVCVILLN